MSRQKGCVEERLLSGIHLQDVVEAAALVSTQIPVSPPEDVTPQRRVRWRPILTQHALFYSDGWLFVLRIRVVNIAVRLIDLRVRIVINIAVRLVDLRVRIVLDVLLLLSLLRREGEVE